MHAVVNVQGVQIKMVVETQLINQVKDVVVAK
ncbi:MAG: hypothetical protein HMLIMOIP_002711 [Candidatus Nitrosomirales archaeon]|jgi:hypothetical protein